MSGLGLKPKGAGGGMLDGMADGIAEKLVALVLRKIGVVVQPGQDPLTATLAKFGISPDMITGRIDDAMKIMADVDARLMRIELNQQRILSAIAAGDPREARELIASDQADMHELATAPAAHVAAIVEGERAINGSDHG